MYVEDNKCDGNCFCDCFILNGVRELTKDQPLHIKTYLDENLIEVEDTDEG